MHCTKGDFNSIIANVIENKKREVAGMKSIMIRLETIEDVKNFLSVSWHSLKDILIWLPADM